jgi:RHS repeat-associated protein
MKIGSEYYWYHNDHLGTPQKLSTTSGSVVWSATYTSFGKATVDPSSTVANPLRFPGQYEDAETGLHYNRFRYYDSDVGRYISVDDLNFSKILLIKEKILTQLLSRFSYPPNLLEKIIVGITNYFLQNEYITQTLTNPYSYSFNNPISYFDHLGLLTKWQNFGISALTSTLATITIASVGVVAAPVVAIGSGVTVGIIGGYYLTKGFGGSDCEAVNNAIWGGFGALLGGRCLVHYR